MNAILEELGRPMSVKEAAQAIGFGIEKMRRVYSRYGGVRDGRRIIFYERRLIDAISKLQQEQQREIPMVGASRNDTAKREKEAAAKAVPDKKRSPEVGGRGKGQDGSRDKSGINPRDPHGVLA